MLSKKDLTHENIQTIIARGKNLLAPEPVIDTVNTHARNKKEKIYIFYSIYKKSHKNILQAVNTTLH